MHLWAHDTGTGMDNRQTKVWVGTFLRTAALALILWSPSKCFVSVSFVMCRVISSNQTVVPHDAWRDSSKIIQGHGFTVLLKDEINYRGCEIV